MGDRRAQGQRAGRAAVRKSTRLCENLCCALGAPALHGGDAAGTGCGARCTRSARPLPPPPAPPPLRCSTGATVAGGVGWGLSSRASAAPIQPKEAKQLKVRNGGQGCPQQRPAGMMTMISAIFTACEHTCKAAAVETQGQLAKHQRHRGLLPCQAWSKGEGPERSWGGGRGYACGREKGVAWPKRRAHQGRGRGRGRDL